MHMDVTSHRASEGRDAAAKRTSESTALQARRAQTDGYVSHQRRANYPRPPGLKQFTSPRKSTSLEPVPPVPENGLGQPLTIAETKTEQARLLTLLRTLSPNLVVDQLCKALAFFGGIPDAPPPADGKFPESAEANGSGSLFVGWIAEIFPNLEEPRRRIAPLPVQSLSQRRPRGRPKGSKASKSRSDKGVKKGAKGATNRVQDLQDDSWVDVEDSVLELNGDGDLVEVGDISGNVASTPPPIPDIAQFNNTPATGSTGGFKSINDTPAAPGSSTKRRGRPKGSKNRPKDSSSSQQASQPTEPALPNEPALANLSAPNNIPNHISTIPIPHKVTPVPVPIPMLGEHARKKTNTGRPKGSKNRPKAVNNTTDQEATSTEQQVLNLLDFPGNSQTTQIAPAGSSFTGITTINDGGASQPDKTTQLPISTTAPSSQIPTPHVKESTISGKKRKRQPASSSTANPQADKPTDGIRNNIMLQQTQLGASQTSTTPIPQPQPLISQSIQQPTVGGTSAPSAKRSRKTQESGSGKRSTPNNMGSKNSMSDTSMIDPALQAAQPTTTSQNHTQPEGLEAHYERMFPLNRTDQTQSNSNRAQKQQQQHQVKAPTGNATSSTLAEGLEAHYERFTSLQNRQDTTRQPTSNRQQIQQQTAQTGSPVMSQTSKAPQMPSTLTHQQNRTSQGYYPQTQTLGSGYNPQAPTYPTNQRQQQHMATGSPGTSLVQHMTNSPQFGAQSNSPLMQGDPNYRGSPSLHNTTGYPPRRTPSASPLDNNYRTTGSTSHGVSNHSPHFGARQTPTTTHSTSHPTMPPSFASFSDSGFLDIQGLDSGNSHGGLGLGTGSYGLGSGGVPQQQRTTSSSTASLYSSATGMNNNYLPSTNVGRAAQNRWPS